MGMVARQKMELTVRGLNGEHAADDSTGAFSLEGAVSLPLSVFSTTSMAHSLREANICRK
jgi:hypothetical protein